jgi:4-carboxymuconolactone decarboxylase
VSNPPQRLVPVTEEQIPQKTLDALAPYRDSHGDIYAIWRTLARHPEALRRFIVFSNHVLGKNALPTRWRELVILRVAYLTKADYEWGQHVRIGREAGLTDPEVSAIISGDWSALADQEVALLEATDELVLNHKLSDGSWARFRSQLTDEQIIDALYTVGQYLTVALIVNALHIAPEDGAERLPAIDVTA